MDIRCRKTTCKYNNGEVCERSEIDVSSGALCDTFELDETKEPQDISKTMLDVPPKYAPFKHCDKINIGCEAKCLFNICGHCNSNGITVLDNGEDASCCNYLHVNEKEFEKQLQDCVEKKQKSKKSAKQNAKEAEDKEKSKKKVG